MALPEVTGRKIGAAPVSAVSANDPSYSYTIEEFCQAERISLSTFYKLKKLGLAPETICYPGGRVIRITAEARAAWQVMMRARKADEQLQRECERNAAAARRAGKLAAASDRHLSKSPETRRKVAHARRSRKAHAEIA